MKAKVVSLEELKQMCEQFLELCVSGSDTGDVVKATTLSVHLAWHLSLSAHSG